MYIKLFQTSQFYFVAENSKNLHWFYLLRRLSVATIAKTMEENDLHKSVYNFLLRVNVALFTLN